MEKKYFVMERECLGIVWSIKKCAVYLYGKQYKLQTDHRSLEFLKVPKFDNRRIMLWVLALQSFVFKVKQLKAKTMWQLTFSVEFLYKILVALLTFL